MSKLKVVSQKQAIIESAAPEHTMSDGTVYKGELEGTWVKLRASDKERNRKK